MIIMIITNYDVIYIRRRRRAMRVIVLVFGLERVERQTKIAEEGHFTI